MKKLPDSTTLGEARKAGRLGDEHLVHLNSAEVGMLENMTYGHGLTINPQTGEKEAFLPFLLSMLPAMLPGIGTALAGAGLPAMLTNPLVLSAIGSGLGTFAETGDLGKGLQAGVMGAALGGIGGKLLGGMGAATANGAGAAAGAAGKAAIPALTQPAAQGLMQAGMGVARAGAGQLGGTVGQALASVGGEAAKAAVPAGMSMMQAGMVGLPGAMMAAGHVPGNPTATEAERKRKARIADAEMEKFPMGRTVNTPPASFRPGFDPEFNFFSPTGYAMGGPVMPSIPYMGYDRMMTPEARGMDESARRGYAGGGLVDSLKMFSPAAMLMSGGPHGDMNLFEMLSPIGMLGYNRAGTPESRAAEEEEKKRKGYAMGGPVMGPGDGTSDSIPATINGTEPAALSDGEYVVRADAVAALGNGSTQAGQQRLDEMVRAILDQAMERAATDGRLG